MEMRMKCMENELDEARSILAKNYLEERGLREQLTRSENAKLILQEKLDNAREKSIEDTKILENERKLKVKAQSELYHTKAKLNQTISELHATQERELSLTSEAKALLQALRDALSDGNTVYDIAESQRKDKAQTRKSTRKFHDDMKGLLQKIASNLESHGEKRESYEQSLFGALARHYEQQDVAIDEMKGIVSNMVEDVNALSNSLETSIANQIRPTIELLASRVQTMVSETEVTLRKGEVTLASSCDEARKQFNSFAEMFEESKAQLTDAETLTQFVIDQTITNALCRVQNMVHSVETALDNSTKQNASMRATLNKIMDDWAQAGIRSTREVQDVSSSQMLSLEKMVSSLDDEMQRHNILGRKARLASCCVGKPILHA